MTRTLGSARGAAGNGGPYRNHGAGASEHYGTRPADIHRLLAGEVGMRIFDADGNGPYSEAQFEQVFTEPMWNFVAH